MLSQDSAWLLNAQELLSQGNVHEAKLLLSEAIAADQSEEDMFGTCCMQASLAAMEGSSSAAIAGILQKVKDSNQDKNTLRLYLEGVSSLARGTGSVKTAQLKFEECLRNDSDFVLANLGLAAVYFRTKQYQQSFGEYRRVLEALGESAPKLCRVGLGLCSFFLKDIAHAQKCLKRALEVDANDVFALLGTLLLNVHTRNLKRLTESVRDLRKLVPDHVVVVQKIADLSYVKANAQNQCVQAKPMLLALIQSVVPSASPAQLAYAKFQEGRLLHSTGDLEQAAALLRAAMDSVPDLVAARIHYAKVQYQRGEIAEAVKELQNIDKNFQASKEVVAMLATHATTSGHHEAAMEYARRLTDLAPGDADTWALAAWCYRLDEERAQLYMSRYCGFVKQHGAAVPLTTRVNMASLEERSTEPLEQVVQEAAGGDVFHKEQLPAEIVPAVFNLGMMLESSSAARAESYYKLLVKHYPMLPEPYYRLHELALKEGRRKQALGWMALLKAARPEDPMPTVYEARTFSNQQNATVSREILKTAPTRKSLPVALAYASICLHGAQAFSSKAAEHLRFARDRYIFALKNDPSNLLAAHGIACCCAILGDTETAQACLHHVAGLVTNDPYVVENLRNHLINIKIGSDSFKHAAYLLSMEANKSKIQYAELAFCKCVQGEFDEGIALLEESIAKFGEANETLYNLSMVCAAAVMKGQSGVKSLTQEEGQRLRSMMTKSLLFAEKFTRQQAVPSFESMSEAQRYLSTIARYTYQLRTRINVLVERGERERQYKARKATEWQAQFQELQEALQRERERQQQQAAEEEAAQRRLRDKLFRQVGLTTQPDGFAEEFPLAGEDDGDDAAMEDGGERNENGKRRRDADGEGGVNDENGDLQMLDNDVMTSMALEAMMLGDQEVPQNISAEGQ